MVVEAETACVDVAVTLENCVSVDVVTMVLRLSMQEQTVLTKDAARALKLLRADACGLGLGVAAVRLALGCTVIVVVVVVVSVSVDV